MKAVEVPALLAELSSLGVTVEPDGAGGLRLRIPKTVPSTAEVARLVRPRKADILEYFERQEHGTAEGKSVPDRVSSPRRTGLPAWEGSPEVYGRDALPRRHAPPSSTAPEERPGVNPLEVCGGCSRWTPDSEGAEGGTCSAGFKAHGLPPFPPEFGTLPVTSRGSRCWAWGGKGWRKAVPA